MNSRSVDSVAEEIANAKAEALGLAGRRLEDSLRALRELDAAAERLDPERPDARPDAARSDAARPDPSKRAKLLAAAADRLLAFLVQREAQGLSDASYVLKFYAVPAEIVTRLGIPADLANRRATR